MMTNCARRSSSASRPTPASRSPSLKSKPPPPFCLFAQHLADVVLLEVGLGGRLDATNVIDAPLATVIAPISMDHIDFLGDTLIKIAGEKAAIIKRHAPVICAEQSPDAMAVIEQQAKRMHAPLVSAGQEWHVNVERGRLVYQDDRGLMDLAAPKLFGPASIRQCRPRHCDIARARRVQDRQPARSRPASSTPNGRRGCSVWRRVRW